MKSAQWCVLLLLLWQTFLLSQSQAWFSQYFWWLAIIGPLGVIYPRPISASPKLLSMGWTLIGIAILTEARYSAEDYVLSTFRFFSAHWLHAIGLWLLGIQTTAIWSWKDRHAIPRWLVPCCIATTFCAFDLPAYGIEIGLLMIGTLAAMVPVFLQWRVVSGSRTFASYETFLNFCTAGLVMILTWTLINAWSFSLPEVQGWFIQTVGPNLSSRSNTRIYINSGNLNAIRNEMQFDPNRIALRVFSDHQPGYLASRRFDTYVKGAWSLKSDRQRKIGERWGGSTIVDPTRQSTNGVPSPPRNANNFLIKNKPEGNLPILSYRVRNDPRRGPVYFSKLGLHAVQGYGDSLAMDSQQAIRAGIRASRDYTLFVPLTSDPEPLSQELLTTLTEVSDSCAPEVMEIAEQVAGQAKTFEAKVDRIRQFFQNTFQYSTQRFYIPNSTDPISHFLSTRSAAHCEFFASATVLLLRAQGIPSRYCTGYRVMDLEEENEDYWIARNKNVHAWAEAYDPETQRWSIVESTPGFRFENDTVLSRRKQMGAEDGDESRRDESGVAERFIEWVRRNLNGMGMVPALVILLMLVGALGILLLVQNFRRPPTKYLLETEHRRIQHRIRKIERKLGSLGIRRSRGETLHDFARRLESHPDLSAEAKGKWITNYLQLANLRYQRVR